MSELRLRRLVVSLFAMSLLLATSRAHAGICDSGIFPTPTTYVFGNSNPLLAGVVDIDEDSRPDIVMFSNYYGNTISILYGNGDGTFQLPVVVPLPANTYVIQVYARDVTADNHADLVILSYTTGSSGYVYSILVLRGNGNGTFQPAVSTTTGGLGDSLLDRLDDDALPDLATSFGGTLQVYRNSGNGTFQPGITSPVISMPTILRAGDFDEDGHPDLITNGYGPNLFFFHGLGDGSFVYSSAIESGFVGSLRAADIDGDGHLDLVASLGNNVGSGGGNVGVASGNGNGTFEAFRLYPRISGATVDTGDLDGDGRTDVISVGPGPYSSLVSVFRNLGGGLLAPERAYAWTSGGPPGSTAALADVNGDGVLDVIATTGNSLSVFIGDGRGGLGASFSSGSSAMTVVADMDTDGIADLVSLHESSVEVTRAIGNGDFATGIVRTVVTGSPTLLGIAIADFNGDGRPDVAVTSYTGSGYWILLGNGDGTLQPAVAYSDFAGGPVVAADFSGDGKIDLLLGGGSQWVLARGNGDGTFQPAIGVPTLPLGASSMVVADFDRDGRPDVATLTSVFPSSPLVSISYSNGDGTFQPAITVPTGSSSSVHLTAGDLNGDLYPDLVVSNSSQASISVILSDGAGGFRPAEFFGSVDSANASVIADLDGDGVADIAIGSDERIVVLRGLPGGNFAGPQTSVTGPPVASVFVADLDGNATPDLVTQAGWILLNKRLAARVPATVEVCLGSQAVLKAYAGGTGAISYQWRKGTVPLSDGEGITGSHTSTLMIAATTPGNAGSYDVVVTDACGTVTSSTSTLIVDTKPTPSISAPVSVPPLSTGVTASVPVMAGHTYQWTITGGSIASGQGTHQIVFSVGPAGTGTAVHVVDTTAGGCSSDPASFVVLSDFLDVPASHPFHSFVVKLARNGITGGCGGGNFCPDAVVTRAQMAVFLLLGEHGASYVPPPATGTVFTDVPIGSFAAAFIERLAAEAITGGCGSALYCPANPVTRAQMAVFLLRAEHGSAYTPPPATGAVFADVPIGSFAAAWIERLAAEGITGGCGNGNYCPTASATRGQMAVFLSKTFSLP